MQDVLTCSYVVDPDHYQAFEILSVWWVTWWSIVIFLICMSLIMGEVEHLFLYLKTFVFLFQKVVCS